jgi:hypothetical protein
MNAINEVSWVSSLVYPMADATRNGLSLGAGKEHQCDDRVVRVELITLVAARPARRFVVKYAALTKCSSLVGTEQSKLQRQAGQQLVRQCE